MRCQNEQLELNVLQKRRTLCRSSITNLPLGFRSAMNGMRSLTACAARPAHQNEEQCDDGELQHRLPCRLRAQHSNLASALIMLLNQIGHDAACTFLWFCCDTVRFVSPRSSPPFDRGQAHALLDRYVSRTRVHEM